MSVLEGKNIVLGVTGCIAAYKAAELVRHLKNQGGQVHVVMTDSAGEFLSPLTFQALSGNPVTTGLFKPYEEKEIGHIALAQRADVLVVAPATANIIGKVANGIADDMLSTIVMAARVPVLFAPAMNVNMWQNPILQKNLKELKSLGFHFVEPGWGDLACGQRGKGRLADTEDILDEIISLLSTKDFSAKRVLVTAGPTEEPLDPVRFITNPSSGKMGFSIAGALIHRGAKVTLISGPTVLMPPRNADCISVRTAREMALAVDKNFDNVDIVIKAAAVADYRPRQVELHKIKKKGRVLVLEMERTSDILASLGKQKGNRILVGFAAETREILSNARKKLKNKNLDMIVANDVGKKNTGFAADVTKASIILADGSTEDLPEMGKDELADRILDKILNIMESKADKLK